MWADLSAFKHCFTVFVLGPLKVTTMEEGKEDRKDKVSCAIFGKLVTKTVWREATSGTSQKILPQKPLWVLSLHNHNMDKE